MTILEVSKPIQKGINEILAQNREEKLAKKPKKERFNALSKLKKRFKNIALKRREVSLKIG